MVTAELSSVRKTIQDAVGMQSDANLTVDMYYDTTIPLLAATDQAQSSGGVGRMVNGYAREIAVGALALISLFMVSMIVKKGSPAPAVTVTPEPELPPHLEAGEQIAGVVGDGKISLDAVELDEDAVHAQQMVEQVSTMVKENPEAAANLVKRWLNRS
jgi:flagellar biosynthesis/type III secretory pathway M-ring protein FliF/YscJ